MPIPTLFVDVTPPGGPGDAVAALVESCTAAFARGRCEMGAARGRDARTARVRWAAGELEARVELDRASGGAVVRELGFSERDAQIERWRTVGLVLGTLADERFDAEPSQPEPARPPAPPPRPSAARAVAPPPRTWMTAGALAGPVGSSWRFGGSLRAAHVVMEPAFGLVSMRYAVRPRDEHRVTLGFLAPSLGAGVKLAPAPLADLDLRLELVGELARASAVEGTRSAAESRAALGARVGVDGSYRLTDSVGLELGADLSYIGPPIELRVASQSVETLSPVSFSLLAGLRWVLR